MLLPPYKTTYNEKKKKKDERNCYHNQIENIYTFLQLLSKKTKKRFRRRVIRVINPTALFLTQLYSTSKYIRIHC